MAFHYAETDLEMDLAAWLAQRMIEDIEDFLAKQAEEQTT